MINVCALPMDCTLAVPSAATRTTHCILETYGLCSTMSNRPRICSSPLRTLYSLETPSVGATSQSAGLDAACSCGGSH